VISALMSFIMPRATGSRTRSRSPPSMPIYLSIGASSRWGLLNRQLEDVQQSREAPTFLFSGAYVAARRRHGPMMLMHGQVFDIESSAAEGIAMADPETESLRQALGGSEASSD
jgi:hypothetical protein